MRSGVCSNSVSAREQAMAVLGKLKRGKLSIKRCIEKYQPLVNRHPKEDPAAYLQ